MSSKLNEIKKQYYRAQQQDKFYSDLDMFHNDNYQRIGKLFLSMMISSSLIKYNQTYSNRDISIGYKKLQQQLCHKHKLNNKKYLYKFIGKYFYQSIHRNSNINNQIQLIEFQLAISLFKNLQNIKNQRQNKNNNKNTNIILLAGDYNIPNKQSKLNSSSNSISSQSQLNLPSNSSSRSNSIIDQPINKSIQNQSLYDKLSQLKKSDHIGTYFQFKFNKKAAPLQSYPSLPNKRQIIKQKQTIKQKNNLQTQDQNLQQFQFQLTKTDIQFDKQDYCQPFFINLISYLQNLSSPQSQLTYIWQHLKFQGFQIYSQPYMNQSYQWTSTAKIKFPLSYQPVKSLQRTQKSKNKRKSKQLACMALLKALYLQYPQVWMIFKYIKQQRHLPVQPMKQPKDNDQIQLITNRSNFIINRDKIQKLFKHKHTDIVKYLQSISAKSQLNTLLQQLPAKIISPKIPKKQVQGKWSVPVRIQYRIQNQIQLSSHPKIYQKIVLCRNAKIAQEQAYMLALIDLYRQNIQLFERIQGIKIAKNIKDVEKKLPLIRNMVQY